jgi:hypothetical protein
MKISEHMNGWVVELLKLNCRPYKKRFFLYSTSDMVVFSRRCDAVRKGRVASNGHFRVLPVSLTIRLDAAIDMLEVCRVIKEELVHAATYATPKRIIVPLDDQEKP